MHWVNKLLVFDINRSAEMSSYSSGAGGRPRSKSQSRSAAPSIDGAVQGQEGRKMHPDDAKVSLFPAFLRSHIIPRSRS